MDVSLDVRKFLKNRRDRAVGSILGYLEQNVRPKLSAGEWESVRKVVLEATNSYHDTVLDLVKSEDGVRNDHLIALLERVDRNLKLSAAVASAAADRNHEDRKAAIVEEEQQQDALWEKAGEPV